MQSSNPLKVTEKFNYKNNNNKKNSNNNKK